MQGSGDESRGQRREQPEQGERGGCGQPGGVEQRTLARRDPDPLRPVARPGVRTRHGLGRDGQGDRAGQHEPLGHQVGQPQRRRGVLGEEPRQQRPEPETAKVGRGGDELGPCGGRARPGRAVQLGQEGGRGRGEQPGADTRYHPAGEQPRDRRPDEEDEPGGHIDADRGAHDPAPAKPVGHVACHQQAGHYTGGVGREDHGDHRRTEMIARLVEHVQRGRDRGERHRYGEYVGDDPEPGPGGPAPPGRGSGLAGRAR